MTNDSCIGVVKPLSWFT